MELEQMEADFTAFALGRKYGDALIPLLPLLREAFMAGWCAARCPDRPAAQTEPPR